MYHFCQTAVCWWSSWGKLAKYALEYWCLPKFYQDFRNKPSYYTFIFEQNSGTMKLCQVFSCSHCQIDTALWTLCLFAVQFIFLCKPKFDVQISLMIVQLFAVILLTLVHYLGRISLWPCWVPVYILYFALTWLLSWKLKIKACFSELLDKYFDFFNKNNEIHTFQVEELKTWEHSVLCWCWNHVIQNWNFKGIWIT